MGQFYDWELFFDKKNFDEASLRNHLIENELIFIIRIDKDKFELDHLGDDSTLTEISEMANNDWSGYFYLSSLFLFFKDEIDAMAAKLRWT